jgi:hypothetical protein
VLTRTNVAGLHALFMVSVDGQIYAQPLIAHGVAVEGGTRDLLLVESMEDTAFAFDAEDGTLVWEVHLGTPALVIDRSTETMYLVVRDCDPSQPATSPSCVQRLVALDIEDGSTRQGVAIGGSASGDAGTVTFDPNAHWCRAGLLLAAGQVYVAFTGGPNGNQHEEDFVYHGWVFGYSAGDFTQPPSVYCATPDASGGAIWQSGSGLAFDGTSVYFATGNGIIGDMTNPPSVFPPGPQDNENSLVKLTYAGDAGPTATIYYDDRPYDSSGDVFQYMESNDIDMSASGPMLIPGTATLVASSKSGIVYDLDHESMAAAQDPLSVFTTPALASGQTLYIYSYSGGPKVNGAPVFWKPDSEGDAGGPGYVYVWPKNDLLKGLEYDYASGTLSPTSWLVANNPITSVGGMLSLSANGGQANTGLLWASSTSTTGSRHVWAFDAETLASLWDTDVPDYAKWVPPVVADGRLYVTTSAPATSDPIGVVVFGL